MIQPDILRAMLEAGCSAEQIVSVVEKAAEAEAVRKAEKRAGNAERQRRHRQRNKSNALHDVTCVSNGDPLSPKEKSPTPPKEITPIPVSEARASSTETRGGFDQFWSMFPNKVGKRDAEKAFASAAKRAALDAILAGVSRYAAKTDDRPWCNPATFLNQNRWEDQPAEAVPRRSTAPPGRPNNAVEANLARRIKRNEPASGRCDYRDAELLPPDKPELRTLVGDLGKALTWGGG